MPELKVKCMVSGKVSRENEKILKLAVTTAESVGDIKDYIGTLLDHAIELRNTVSRKIGIRTLSRQRRSGLNRIICRKTFR